MPNNRAAICCRASSDSQECEGTSLSVRISRRYSPNQWGGNKPQIPVTLHFAT